MGNKGSQEPLSWLDNPDTPACPDAHACRCYQYKWEEQRQGFIRKDCTAPPLQKPGRAVRFEDEYTRFVVNQDAYAPNSTEWLKEGMDGIRIKLHSDIGRFYFSVKNRNYLYWPTVFHGEPPEFVSMDLLCTVASVMRLHSLCERCHQKPCHGHLLACNHRSTFCYDCLRNTNGQCNKCKQVHGLLALKLRYEGGLRSGGDTHDSTVPPSSRTELEDEVRIRLERMCEGVDAEDMGRVLGTEYTAAERKCIDRWLRFTEYTLHIRTGQPMNVSESDVLRELYQQENIDRISEDIYMRVLHPDRKGQTLRQFIRMICNRAHRLPPGNQNHRPTRRELVSDIVSGVCDYVFQHYADDVTEIMNYIQPELQDDANTLLRHFVRSIMGWDIARREINNTHLQGEEFYVYLTELADPLSRMKEFMAREALEEWKPAVKATYPSRQIANLAGVDAEDQPLFARQGDI